MQEDYDRMNWMYRYYAAQDKAVYLALEEQAQLCPKCGKDVGHPTFEEDDPSVGIFGWGFSNYCLECDCEYMVYDDAHTEIF